MEGKSVKKERKYGKRRKKWYEWKYVERETGGKREKSVEQEEKVRRNEVRIVRKIS